MLAKCFTLTTVTYGNCLFFILYSNSIVQHYFLVKSVNKEPRITGYHHWMSKNARQMKWSEHKCSMAENAMTVFELIWCLQETEGETDKNSLGCFSITRCCLGKVYPITFGEERKPTPTRERRKWSLVQVPLCDVFRPAFTSICYM